MERLWAPWRISYVKQPDKSEGGCFLCKAAAQEPGSGNLVLFRGESSFCLLNRWPYNNGHLMVAPLAHKSDLAELTPGEMLEQMEMLKRCKRLLEGALAPAGYNVGLNLGGAAGAGLATHLHWHIVPRWEGDTNFMPVLADTKVIPQSLEQLLELLREADNEESKRMKHES
ncbi:MAG: HIT domain-containing protein [Planctomycetes bacterium]|nr:HIT domain-containing protein [Planctomycetota bacterium]